MPANSKVLLVEDSKLLRMANERALSKAGFQVATAIDGEQALQYASELLPDVILLDMLLPKIAGPEVLHALKTNPVTRGIPVIVLTSLSQKNEEKLLLAGAVAYFEKSSLELDKSSDRLASAVEDVLRKINHQKDLDLRLKESALKLTSTEVPAEVWQVEVKGVESSACTTTAPPPRLKS